MGVYGDNYKTVEANNIVWMMVRFFNRAARPARTDLPEPELPHSSELPTDVEAVPVNQLLEKQTVQFWSAYNSLVCNPSPTDALLVVDNAFALPIINAPAREWPTLVTALNQLTRLNTLTFGPDIKLVVQKKCGFRH